MELPVRENTKFRLLAIQKGLTLVVSALLALLAPNGRSVR